MKNLWMVKASVLACLASAPFLWHDSEWPPDADPASDAENPGPGDPLYMGEIQIQIPQPYRPWFTHAHQGTYGWSASTSIAIGDVEGADDGDLNVVLYAQDEAVLAARLDLDWGTKTGSLTPVWFWLSPRGEDPVNGYGEVAPGGHSGVNDRNVLIWDFDGDGKNEVAVVASKWNGNWRKSLFLLQEDPVGGPGPWSGYPLPAPLELASTPVGLNDWKVTSRLGICKVRDTAYPQDLCMHDHNGTRLPIWKYESGALTQIYEMDVYNGNTLGADPVGTHEFNWGDADGDGYDEFFCNGMLDFVNDVNGVATPINGMFGQFMWTSGYPNSQGKGHFDELYFADWDPNRPGPELFGVTEDPWPAPPPWSADLEYDVFFDPLDGTVLRINTDAPATHGENILGGNFTATEVGLEAICTPKDWTGTVVPNGQVTRSGGYAINAQQEELAMDGVNFGSQNPGDPARRSTGPAWDNMKQIDWNGDYTEDEILSAPWSTLIVWRMGEKGDWGATMPPGMPTQAQVEDGTPPIDGTHWVHYYQGSDGSKRFTWGWNNGGPGRYTHYYQKLAEIYPHAGIYFHEPWDVFGDHREELLVMNPQGLHILYNPNPLTTPEQTSPLLSRAYRQWRLDALDPPFDYQGVPQLAKLEVRPLDRALPGRVVGMPLNSTLQLQALAHLDSGEVVDVSGRVTWEGDPDVNAYLPVGSRGLVTSGTWEGSARIHATLSTGENEVVSLPCYVYASDDDEPVILTAGYKKSFIDEGNPNALKVEARIAQKDQQTLYAAMYNENGTPWLVGGNYVFLYDDGLSAHSDAEAGDGIFSAKIAPGPQDGDGISIGDNVKVILAAWLNAGSLVYSDPWPWIVVNSITTVPTYPPPTTTLDANVQFGPKIRACGTRGVRADSGFLFLEAEVAPMPYAPEGDPLTVTAYLPWSGQSVPLVDRGNNYFSAWVPVSPPDGAHIVDVRARSDYVFVNQSPWYSDYNPRLRLHDVLLDTPPIGQH